jgi:hypothetical protein
MAFGGVPTTTLMPGCTFSSAEIENYNGGTSPFTSADATNSGGMLTFDVAPMNVAGGVA